jgi:hypothetical protein
MTNALRLIAPALLLATLAACGGGSGGAGASPSASASMSDADLLAIGKEVVQCMRDNGLPDMADPYVEAGKLKLAEADQAAMEGKYSDEQLESAREACQDVYDKVPQGAIEQDGKDADVAAPGPEDIPALTQFAQCVREHGIAEWPDPNSEGQFPVGGTSVEGKPSEIPGLEAAFEACRQHWDGPLMMAKS